jgi:hypothetical protein
MEGKVAATGGAGRRLDDCEALTAAPEGDASWIEDLHCTLLHTADGVSLESLEAAVGKDATLAADALCVIARLACAEMPFPPCANHPPLLLRRFIRPDNKLAALRVTAVTIGGEVFAFDKSFPHVTVWKSADVEAVESNALCEQGNAEVVTLAAPLTLPATIRMA